MAEARTSFSLYLSPFLLVLVVAVSVAVVFVAEAVWSLNSLHSCLHQSHALVVAACCDPTYHQRRNCSFVKSGPPSFGVSLVQVSRQVAGSHSDGSVARI
eukprot:GEZU01026585.1.p3 GENE.GEZU01026585.1~~GEZU01026585.1.p3  ORF type:complete len:100 (+),score=7.73 GEZU01026585.1:150-449(+)